MKLTYLNKKLSTTAVFAALFFAMCTMDLAMAQFKENCPKGSDSECTSQKPFCCTLTNQKDKNKKMKMCVSKNEMSGDKIAGELQDDGDGVKPDDKLWQAICPTMIPRCNSLSDCGKDKDQDNQFCCSTDIKTPAGHPDKVSTCIPKQAQPMGDWKFSQTYLKQDGQSETIADGALTYTYMCPSMLADCEVYLKKGGKYVLNDQNQKQFEPDYACGKGGLADKTHCCSLIPKNPAIKGSMKMCMKHDAGSSPFGKWMYPKDAVANAKNMSFEYVCPSLAANCTAQDTCDAKSKQPYCCNLQSVNPGIKGDTMMCMASLGNLTGQWTLNQKKDEGNNKIDYKFRCPAAVLQNCTGDPEKDCNYKQPYCCKLKNTDKYEWKTGAVSKDIQMCMDTPRKSAKLALTGKWDDPTGAAKFDYDCPDQKIFDIATSSFDEFFDYAINFSQGNNKKLTKAGLKYDQCQKTADCPKLIKDSKSCCVQSVMMLGDWNLEGKLVNMTNTTVKRCMKEQIPDSQIFTEIDDYQVDMSCTEAFASRLGSTAALFLTLATIIANAMF